MEYILKYFQTTTFTCRVEQLNKKKYLDGCKLIDHGSPYFTLVLDHKDPSKMIYEYNVIHSPKIDTIVCMMGKKVEKDSKLIIECSSSDDDDGVIIRMYNYGWVPRHYLPFVIDFLEDYYGPVSIVNRVESNEFCVLFEKYIPDDKETIYRLFEEHQNRLEVLVTDERFNACDGYSSVRSPYREFMKAFEDFSGTRNSRHKVKLRPVFAAEGGFFPSDSYINEYFEHEFYQLYKESTTCLKLFVDYRVEIRGSKSFFRFYSTSPWLYMSFVLCLKHFGISYNLY